MSILRIILLLILLALALPVGIERKSWLHLVGAMVVSFFAVVLPLFVFSLSSLMVPEWKGACHYGWVDCFIVGKLALTPFVLAATAALYKTEVLRADVFQERWTVIGIFLGAIVATVCFIFGLICLEWNPIMLVPLYVAVWYVLRAIQFVRLARFKWHTYFKALLGTTPFWLASWWWSRQVYESLPNEAPQGCFVVTAAGRGHVKFVGPFREMEHRGRKVRANQQLITLWQFEDFWRGNWPCSHRLFRRFYNRFGPKLAAQIHSPWVADLIFLALKPLEILANFINHHGRKL